LKLENVANKRILLSPLNWGMGHVARCISIIDKLLKQSNVIFIACNSDQQKIVEAYFKNKVEFIEHEGYPFRFSGNGNFGFDLFTRSPKLKKRLKKERLEVLEYCEKYTIDIVLSDHRYGFHSEKTTSIFITHQLNLPLKWYEKSIKFFHKRLIQGFDFIWVLDNDQNEFAGKLSLNKSFSKVEYIGIQSRFSLYEQIPKLIEQICIVSGPSPYDKQFLEERMNEEPISCIFIVPPHLENVIANSGRIYYLTSNWIEIDQIILKAKRIISRSGYSTVMDVYTLKAEATFYPTPGQMEQIYLNQLQE
jgi:hypothetical protein